MNTPRSTLLAAALIPVIIGGCIAHNGSRPDNGNSAVEKAWVAAESCIKQHDSACEKLFFLAKQNHLALFCFIPPDKNFLFLCSPGKGHDDEVLAMIFPLDDNLTKCVVMERQRNNGKAVDPEEWKRRGCRD